MEHQDQVESTIIKHIMKILKPYIDQVLVVSPSEVSNRAYEGLVDSTLIHDRLYLADQMQKRRVIITKKCACRAFRQNFRSVCTFRLCSLICIIERLILQL